MKKSRRGGIPSGLHATLSALAFDEMGNQAAIRMDMVLNIDNVPRDLNVAHPRCVKKQKTAVLKRILKRTAHRFRNVTERKPKRCRNVTRSVHDSGAKRCDT